MHAHARARTSRPRTPTHAHARAHTVQTHTYLCTHAHTCPRHAHVHTRPHSAHTHLYITMVFGTHCPQTQHFGTSVFPLEDFGDGGCRKDSAGPPGQRTQKKGGLPLEGEACPYLSDGEPGSPEEGPCSVLGGHHSQPNPSPRRHLSRRETLGRVCFLIKAPVSRET